MVARLERQPAQEDFEPRRQGIDGPVDTKAETEGWDDERLDPNATAPVDPVEGTRFIFGLMIALPLSLVLWVLLIWVLSAIL